MRARTIAASRAMRLIDFAAARGLDPGALASVAGLALPARSAAPPADDERVPITRYFDLWSAIARALHDPGLAIAFARTVRPEDYQVMGFVIMTSSSGLEALRRGIRFGTLFDDSGRWEIEEAPDRVTLEWVRSGPLTLGHRLSNELLVAELVHMMRRGDAAAPLGVRFRHPAPDDTSVHRRFFGCPLEFGARRDGFTVPRAWLERRPRGANAELHEYLRGQAESLLRAAGPTTSLTERVHREILREPREPSEHDVARRLGVSERTLRRKLAAEGTGFRELAERLRSERAEQMLRETQLSATEIAFVLGFSNVAAFGRAVRRWCGKSPRQLRAR